MSDLLRDVSRLFGRTDKQRRRDELGDAYWRRANTPKASRPKVEAAPAPALTDPVRRLGHAPRGRKKSR